MNPIMLKMLQAGKAAGSKIAGVGRGVGRYAQRNYQSNPSAYKAAGAGAIGGLAVGAGINDNQNTLNAMFENFDTTGVMSMAEQNISKWEKAGAGEESSRWLGLIDTVYERQSELEKDPRLAEQFSTMLEAMDVNYLDMNLEHHNQRRQKAGFDPIQGIQQDSPEYDENVRR